MSVANQAKLDRYRREDAAFWTPERIAEQKAAQAEAAEKRRAARQAAFNKLTDKVSAEIIAVACVTNKIGYEILETIMINLRHTEKQASVFTRLDDGSFDKPERAAALKIFQIIAKKRWGVE